MKNFCFFVVITIYLMTPCIHCFADTVSENEVQASSENELQPSSKSDSDPLSENNAQPLSESQVQSTPGIEPQTLTENQVQSLSKESHSMNQKVNLHMNGLQEVLNECMQYEDLLQEMESGLKELYIKAALRKKKSDGELVPETKTVSKAKTQAALKPKGLGKWWLRNALTYDPLPSKVLNHFEFSYSFTRMTGNMTVDKHLIKNWLVTRYKRMTSYLNYSFDKRTSSRASDYYADGQIIETNLELRKSTKHLVSEEIRFAILKQLYSAVGFMYEEDDFISLDKRITTYLGFGARPIQTKGFMFKFFAAFGHENKDYTEDYHEMAGYFTKEERSVLLPDYDTDTVKSDIFYCDQNIRWSITDNLSFNEAFMTFIQTDDTDKYRWILDLGLEFQFTKHFTLMLNYNETFDKAMNPLMGRKRDTSKNVMLKVVF